MGDKLANHIFILWCILAVFHRVIFREKLRVCESYLSGIYFFFYIETF